MEVLPKLSVDDRKRIALVNSSNLKKYTKRSIIKSIEKYQTLSKHQIRIIKKSNLNFEKKKFILETMPNAKKKEDPEQVNETESDDQDDSQEKQQSNSDSEDDKESSNGDGESESDENEDIVKGERNFKMLSRPDDFDGSPTKARVWMQDFLYCAKVNRWTHSLKAKRLPAFLKGSARNWYRVAIMDSDIEEDFSAIQKQFERVFMPLSNRRAIAREIEVKKMQAGEAVSNFIMDMRLLCRQYDTKMPEGEIIDKIRSRLTKQFFPNITQVKTQNISEFMQECILIEQGIREKEGDPITAPVLPTCYNCGKPGHLEKSCRSIN